jgi:nitroimidazol reductase NimA-like FMN-containing flavoprotein (pyridoxamine 5'-phosphate oxidase superfamily)
VSGDDGRPAEMFALDTATCLALLSTQHVGRLVTGGDELCVIPVNYVLRDGAITVRTADDSAAVRSTAQGAAFEVDMFDERTQSGWSVVVRGRLVAVPEGDGHAELETWAPGPRDRWVIVPVESITGRLLRGAVDGTDRTPSGCL